VSFTIDPVVYPRTYASSFRYISDDRNTKLCRTCTFRPWARFGQITKVVVRVVHSNGTVEFVRARKVGARWVATVTPSDKVTIEPGGIIDTFGETNAKRLTF
jgi:hypothetical protein